MSLIFSIARIQLLPGSARNISSSQCVTLLVIDGYKNWNLKKNRYYFIDIYIKPVAFTFYKDNTGSNSEIAKMEIRI